MLTRVVGDIWSYTDAFIVIPTNLEGVNGRGIARQMADRWPGLSTSMRNYGKSGMMLDHWVSDHSSLHTYRPDLSLQRTLIIFPVKVHWRDEAGIDIIRRSCSKLRMVLENQLTPEICLMPRVGCGFGELSFDVMYPVLCHELSGLEHRVRIIEPSQEVFQNYIGSFKPGVRSDKSVINPNTEPANLDPNPPLKPLH